MSSRQLRNALAFYACAAAIRTNHVRWLMPAQIHVCVFFIYAIGKQARWENRAAGIPRLRDAFQPPSCRYMVHVACAFHADLSIAVVE